MKAYMCAMHSWCTDLGRLTKEAQAFILKSMLQHLQGHSHHAALKQPVVRHNNSLFMVSPKANVPQSGVTQHEVSTCAHIHASAMHTGPKLCPSFVSTAQDTNGYCYSTN